MSDSLKKDLALFNLIVEELLKEEKKNPVSSLINAEDLHDKVDFSLSEQACINQKFTQALKDLVLKPTPVPNSCNLLTPILEVIITIQFLKFTFLPKLSVN